MRVKCFGRSVHERQLTRYDLIMFPFLAEWKKGECSLCTYQAYTIRRKSFSATGILRNKQQKKSGLLVCNQPNWCCVCVWVACVYIQNPFNPKWSREFFPLKQMKDTVFINVMETTRENNLSNILQAYQYFYIMQCQISRYMLNDIFMKKMRVFAS